MEKPQIAHPVRDPERNVEYVVLAYRALEREEVLRAIRAYTTAKKRPAKNSRVEIVTTLGATPGS